MRKIIDYKIISHIAKKVNNGWKSEEDLLADEINNYIKNGYEPIGGVCVTYHND